MKCIPTVQPKTMLLAALAGTTLLACQAHAASVSLSSNGDSYIRTDTKNTAWDNTELLVGRFQTGTGNHFIRSILQFDLSSIPDTATITDVNMSLFINIPDTGSSGSTGWVGPQGIQVLEVTSDAVFNGTATQSPTWNERDNPGNVAWGTQGGDFGPTVLSSIIPSNTIPSPQQPSTVSAGEEFAFASSADFINAITNNLGDDEVQLIVYTPGIETNFNSRKLYRFGSSTNGNEAIRPVLTIGYIPEPGSVTVGLALGGLCLLKRRRRAS